VSSLIVSPRPAAAAPDHAVCGLSGRRSHLKLALYVAAVAVLVAAHLFALDALKAAGVQGVAPNGADAIKSLIETMKENWMWLVVASLALAMPLVGGMLVFGAESALRWLGKMAAGLAIIVVVTPAVLA
jgi:hypothetical protein